MKGTSVSPVRRNNDGFHRYLKPGALAQIRNSRINARSNFPLSLTHSLVSDPSPSERSLVLAPQTLTMDQVPHLLSKIYGPYRIGRKKLGPARSVGLETMLDLNPSPNSVLESTNGNSNVLSNDVLVAH
ncbi:PREDICTED: uncharacterized protein LOC109126780 [Camelina sativa]|uniref:Uncharacterized protein LOC109126780 n=1 Tax=Camelina sativa TaxID=90675 RepID=A0ABM1QH86_CAMSA|nr:PREDICTED: uncharacterized protein LOC109126780 [Camelina sativa]